MSRRRERRVLYAAFSDEPSAGIRTGRFEGAMDEAFAGFNASIAFDRRLYKEDILGSAAHVRMLGDQGVISREDAEAIERGLDDVLEEIEAGLLPLREDLEDIHINVENALRERIGEAAGRVHTARSRNDQVALDTRMFVRDGIDRVMADLRGLMTELVEAAARHIDYILPGYTHLQRAQPVRLAHHLLAYFEMFRRDWERFRDARPRANVSPLGSAALAGTTYPIDREAVARELGFDAVSRNSMDAVSDRDFIAEFIFNSALVMTHLSRLAEELIIWSSQEFGFCELPDEYCSGSSIMPQKKNPDACELVRGKTGRVYGDLTAVLTMLKALPLTYNKDLQEDKEPLFDAADTVMGSLEIFTRMIPRIVFDKKRMIEAAADPTLAATDMADELVRRGVPFREAHAAIGERIRSALEGRAGAASLEKPPSPEEMTDARSHIGGTAAPRVKDEIERARELIARMETRSRAGVPA